MGCNHLQTEELDRLVEANLEGENWRLSPELEKELPEIRAELAEDAERRLAFEDNQERREILKEDLSPQDRERVDQEKAQQEVVKFRTLSGEFEIRRSPSSNLTADQIKRLYREETPHAVTRHMWGEAFFDKVKERIGKDGKIHVTLGQHGILRNDKGVSLIYKHSKEILDIDCTTQPVLQRGNPEEINRALKQKEIETRHHEIGEEIYDRHLGVEELAKCDMLFDRAVKGGWMEKVCTHSEPSPQQYFCDAYKMFKTDPGELQAIDADTFQLVQSKYISLEVEDTFASLEGREGE